MAPPASSTFNRLKIITIAAAFLQIIVFVYFISNLFYMTFPGDIIGILAVCVRIVFYVINIVSAGCFIYGAFRNDPKARTYDYCLLTNIVILILHLEFDYAVLAVYEFFVLWCTVVLRKKYQTNDPETPPPTYNSCKNDTQTPLAGHSESNAQINSEASPEIVSDPQVDNPKTRKIESASSNGSVDGLVK